MEDILTQILTKTFLAVLIKIYLVTSFFCITAVSADDTKARYLACVTVSDKV